jgi:hypothetical protein
LSTAVGWSRGQEATSGEEIHLRPANQLAFQHLQAVDLALDRALPPRQRDGGLDGGQVRPEPFGNAPEGREGALGGTRQPWFELGRLTPADEAGEVLCQCHRLGQFGRRLGQLCQRVAILLCRPC